MKRRKNNLVFPTMLMRLQLVLCVLVVCSLGQAEDIVKGDFELVDHQGQSVTEHSFDGKLRLVFFGYTQCPDVCPTTLFEVARVMRSLGDKARQVQPIFISVDRENDTPEQLAKYVAAFHPSLVGLTGSKQQLDAVAESFKVTYGVERASDGASSPGAVFHSSYLFVMDRQGAFLDVFGYGTKAEVIEARLREYF
jgi:protein SCO1/2